MKFGILSGPGILLLSKFLDLGCMFPSQNMYIGGFEGFHVVYNKSFHIMSRVFSNFACALRGVIREIMTCWYGRTVANGLLYMYFICNIFWAC